MRLIVNGDDLGLTGGVNAGIFEAHDRGVVTSASLMVRMPAAEAAAAGARQRPRLGLGLHVDLGEWAHDGTEWQPLYTVVDLDDAPAVTAEVERQIAEFQRLTGRLPTHLDSHQHVHRDGAAAAAVTAAADRLGRPVRDRDVPYCGDFYGQHGHGEPLPEAITTDALLAVIDGLDAPIVELGCHPGRADGLRETGTMYVEERERELAVLCDPRLRRALAEREVELCTWAAAAVPVRP